MMAAHMAHSPDEKAFSKAVGRICETEIAPVLLAGLCDPGSIPMDLNRIVRMNHPWADWAVWRNGKLQIVAVRGRIKWESRKEPGTSTAFSPLPRTVALTVRTNG